MPRFLALALICLLALEVKAQSRLCLANSVPSLEVPRALMTTRQLLDHTANGGSPRRGIDPHWSSYKSLTKTLSLRGPFGPVGPLSERGPVGERKWNPSYWLQKKAEEESWNYMPDADSDIFGNDGPLGDHGPLAKDWGEGAYSVFGTTGPLGPLGLLGPLGAIGGARLLKNVRGPDRLGEYRERSTGKIVRTLRVPFGACEREFDLFEFYHWDHARKLSREGALDTSFATDDTLELFDVEQVFRIKAPRTQIVTVMITPERGIMRNVLGIYQKLNFDLEVSDVNGKLLASSIQLHHVNFVQIAVPSGTQLQIKVKRQGLSARPQAFRLLVVGANAELFEHFADYSKESEIDPFSQLDEMTREWRERDAGRS